MRAPKTKNPPAGSSFGGGLSFPLFRLVYSRKPSAPEDTHAQQRQVHIQELAQVIWLVIRISLSSVQKSGRMRNTLFHAITRTHSGPSCSGGEAKLELQG